eukprot:2055807-Prymnesium_polylepis.2
MNRSQWLEFWREEQLLPAAGEGGELPEHWQVVSAPPAPAETDALFEVGKHTDLQTDATIGILQFKLQLLNSHNNVVAPALHPTALDAENEPFAHYWTAASHKYSRWDSNCGRFAAAPDL